MSAPLKSADKWFEFSLMAVKLLAETEPFPGDVILSGPDMKGCSGVFRAEERENNGSVQGNRWLPMQL